MRWTTSSLLLDALKNLLQSLLLINCSLSLLRRDKIWYINCEHRHAKLTRVVEERNYRNKLKFDLFCTYMSNRATTTAMKRAASIEAGFDCGEASDEGELLLERGLVDTGVAQG